MLVKSRQLTPWDRTSPISGQCFHFIPPKNPRQPNVFCCFQGVQNGNIDQKSVSKILESVKRSLDLLLFLFEMMFSDV